MIKVDQFMDIKVLHQQGHSIREIARITGMARNTVRAVLRGEHPIETRSLRQHVNPSQRAGKIDPFKEYLQKRWSEYRLSAVRLLPEIVALGYQGSVHTIRRYLATLKAGHKRAAKATVRFETPPGKQAQCDWGHVGKFATPDGKSINIYVFVMVLGYSRQLYLQFTTSMKIPELIRCHQAAFAFFHGIPQTILYDNMSQVRTGPGRLNTQFAHFAAHHGFEIKTHRPYRPRTKGKVERMVNYLKDNFLNGLTFQGLEDLQAQGQHWVNTVANARVHATTQQVPAELWRQEQDQLIPLTEVRPYLHAEQVERVVGADSLVRLKHALYSVPPEYVGRNVVVMSAAGNVSIHCGDLIIAEHPQAATPGQTMVHAEHLAELWKTTLAHTPLRGERHCNVTFDEQVEQRALAIFEQCSVSDFEQGALTRARHESTNNPVEVCS